MNRLLQRLVQLALAATVGGVSAYGLIFTQALTADGTPTAALVAAAEVPAFRLRRARCHALFAEKPAGIVSYRDAVARAAASVVTVHSAHALKGALPLAPKVVAKGLASGVIVDRDGYIVTNYHVIEQASQLAVARTNGTVYLAQVVGTDPHRTSPSLRSTQTTCSLSHSPISTTLRSATSYWRLAIHSASARR